MALLTVLTPVHPDGFGFLGRAHASVAAQRMPPGWCWEWVVQVDDLDAAAPLPDDPRIRVGHGPRGGPSVARNLGLARSSGTLVRNLDADDELLPGALSGDVEVLVAEPGLGWTTSLAVDLPPDPSGPLPEPPGPPEPRQPPVGRIERGSVRRWWTEHGVLPVHPTTLCARRDLLLALGGWTALPSGGDTALLLALDAVSDGRLDGRVSVRYRKHPGQVTAQPLHARDDLVRARRALTLQRAQALRDLGWRFP